MRAALSILVVDDDPGALRLLEAMLAQAGYRIRTAPGPREALARVEQEVPDLLITDLRMPEMSGVELLRAVRARFPQVVCLIITGFASDESVEEAFGAGAQDLLAKPVHFAEIQARVGHAAELVLLRREVALLRAALAAGGEAPALRVGRLRELDRLPALPGQAAAPLSPLSDETAQRLALLHAMQRYGMLTPEEMEEKRRDVLGQ
jgi:CheY-like chemotaxis protein